MDEDEKENIGAEVPEKEEIDIKAIEERAVARAKAELAQELARAEAAQMASRPSRVEALKADLLKEGESEDAIEMIYKMQAAMIADVKDREKAQAQEKSVKQFVEDCEAKAFDALEDVLEAIPQIKGAGMGMKRDLVNQTADLLMNDKRFAAEADKVRRGVLPSSKKLKEAAAIVADKAAKSLGLTARPAGIDLTSSKPQPKEEDADPEDLPRNAKKIYNLNVGLGLDHKTAMSRARKAIKELS